MIVDECGYNAYFYFYKGKGAVPGCLETLLSGVLRELRFLTCCDWQSRAFGSFCIAGHVAMSNVGGVRDADRLSKICEILPHAQIIQKLHTNHHLRL